jgi:hypothetical protein
MAIAQLEREAAANARGKPLNPRSAAQEGIEPSWPPTVGISTTATMGDADRAPAGRLLGQTT